ncbi:TRAP transporter small permease [Inquilinus limosus]|uniref:TRAP transporter small permease n=1 Tax=Inquilinus limosus TaxID=171674 RepID=UPI0004158804|nr:TRAP transporter small permease [Inquilinus limosus]
MTAQPTARPAPASAGRILRRLLDALYLGAGILAALSLLALLLVIVAAMAARWLGLQFPGGTEYAAYLLAASSFLALALALRRGAHIRVGLLLNALGSRRRWGELWCWAVGAALGCYFAWYAVAMVRWSYKLHDVSQGQDATPLWIPQLAMAAGAVIFAIALLDGLISLILTGSAGVEAGEESQREI